VNEITDLLDHPHLHTVPVETPAGTVDVPTPAPVWTEGERRYRPVPALGAHSDAVRHEFMPVGA
jgi:crotonobetainyl-CoA:carnitine CoA-transferase CaiB-like acyl-CoA transferase